MIRKGLVLSLALTLLLCFTLTVSAAAEGFPAGDWAFGSDPGTSVLRLSEDGTAVYRDAEYTWEDDGQFLLLKDAKGEVLKLRYRVTEKNKWLYVIMNYTRKEGTTGEDLQGVWNLDGSEAAFFEFSSKNTFLEDGVFSGTYKVDYENNSFTLIYPMLFDDTECFFTIDGQHMTVEYPWSVVETQEAAEQSGQPEEDIGSGDSH